MNLNATAYIVTGGLVVICCVAMVTNNKEVAIGSLAALAGWLGGNSNGKRQTS